MSAVIYDICIYILEMLIAFAFFQRNYNKKRKSNYIIFLIGLLLFLPCSFIFTLFENEIINLTLFFAINFIFSVTCFEISLRSAAIQSILLDAIMYISELLTIFFASAVTKMPTNLYKTNFLAFVILSSISKVLYLVFSQLFSLIIRKNRHDVPEIKHFLPLFIFPVLTIVTCTVFLFIALDFQLSAVYQIMIFAICVLFIFACIFVFIYYQLLLNNEAKIHELESERKLNSLNEAYLEVLQHQNDELQMLFHDTKHHYLTLSNLDNIADVKDYIEKLYPDLENKNRLRISDNKMLDLILNKYIVLCKNNNIHFSYEVKTADLKYIDDTELSVILNNALDNAVESAKGSAERSIEFSLRHMNNMDLLSIVNSCDAPPHHQGNNLITSKKHSVNHGFGSKSIERHTKANHGTYEWFYNPEEKRFHLSLLFQNETSANHPS